ncbi:alpha/beta hydrolase [Reichenbachiella sp. MALMAid0571]|uniref:alpha/beta hydrolase n=1 Tax=Reichenbachiella sp. MALMAid0571 TaxID=3143939 RepID=UPI0032DEE0ED
MNHHLNISFKASYATLNEITSSTKHIWIVCHGYGQLASHFIKRFDVFDQQEHFVLAPQGLSKFYLKDYTKVGASWMTKEDRETDLENQRSYFDVLLDYVFASIDLNDYEVHLLGFSQGVSTISRLAAYKKIPFTNLILWAGGFPPELTPKDFSFANPQAKLKIVLGDQDALFRMPKFQTEIDKAELALNRSSEFIRFDGKHEVSREVLKVII